MHFYKEKKQTHLDMSGELLLTRNEKPVTCNVRSAVPKTIKGGTVLHVAKGCRIRATLSALKFIWGGV